MFTYNFYVRNAYLFEKMKKGETVSREEAKANGCQFYYTGEPCSHGHLSVRHVNGRHCRQCQLERTRKHNTLDMVDGKMIWKRSMDTIKTLDTSAKRKALEEQRDLLRIEREHSLWGL